VIGPQSWEVNRPREWTRKQRAAAWLEAVDDAGGNRGVVHRLRVPVTNLPCYVERRRGPHPARRIRSLVLRRRANVGNGVYAAIDVQTAEYYLSHFGGAGMLLELRADVRRVLQVRFTLDSPKRPLFQLLALLPSGLRRFLDATIREPDQPAALTDLYVEEEYDAVEITADRFSPVIGGNQLLILDPRRVVVVRDDAADAT